MTDTIIRKNTPSIRRNKMSKKEAAKHHYFASSSFEWRVDQDATELARKMDDLGDRYTIYRVPLSIDADYPIRDHAPSVEGTERL